MASRRPEPHPETWTEEFEHRGIKYKITWRPVGRPRVVYSMSRQEATGQPMSVRESLLASKAFRRKNKDRIDAMRRRH